MSENIRCECGLRIDRRHMKKHRSGRRHKERMDLVLEIVEQEKARLLRPQPGCQHPMVAVDLHDGKQICTICELIKIGIKKYIASRGQ